MNFYSRDFALGIDVFLGEERYKKPRLALVTNDAATTSAMELSRVALLKNGFNLTKLFSPEHGISAQGEDGAFQQHMVDNITRLPVISLYGDKLAPSAADLEDIDLVLFDLPDVGCRFYTYQWTLSYIMEACAENDKPLVIADRPNPLGGVLSAAEGPGLDETHCASFIGRWDIPLKHACTIGELANYWRDTRLPQLHQVVLSVIGWSRNLLYSDLKLPFVPTSPAIPDVITAILYPGMGLLEGINVSEGRGTTVPFKVAGAPWINSNILCDQFNALRLDGVVSMPYTFTPAWGKHAHETCHGIMLHITDGIAFKPVHTGLSLLNLLASLYPRHIRQHDYPTVANPSGELHLDKLTGLPASYDWIREGQTAFMNELPSKLSCTAWKDKIKPFLLYT